MWLEQWYRSWLTGAAPGSRKQAPRPRRRRPALEPLEDRNLPSSFTAAGLWPGGAHTGGAPAMHAPHNGGTGSGIPIGGGGL